MNTEQTLFDNDGKPLGKAITDNQTGRTTFQPRNGNNALARRTWRSLEACLQAVMVAAHKREAVP